MSSTEKKYKNIGTFIFGWGLALLFLWVLGTGVWDGFIKPGLGYIGVIEYKTKTLIRYETFLTKASACKEKKKVYSEKSSKYPIFHLFKCANGKELIWKYKVKVIRKSSDSRWILE